MPIGTSNTPDFKSAIRRIVEGHAFSMDDAAAAMDLIMQGEATPAQIAALVTALRMRGETVDEIAGFAMAMRRHAVTVEPGPTPYLVDTCGTGGDDSGTFNISTTAAFVIAGAGATVAKHGNRAVTSQCGSADLLEGLGVNIDMSPEHVRRCLDGAGFGFMFAPRFHPSFRHAGLARREIGIRTVFNMLGPLTNPAGVRRQLIGVGDIAVGEKLAAAQGMLGGERVMVVHSGEGLDEISISGETSVLEYTQEQGEVRRWMISPNDFGLEIRPLSELQGGDLPTNIAITQGVLAGLPGAARDVVILNAAAGLYVSGAVETIEQGVGAASASIDQGDASAVLDRLIIISNTEDPQSP